jgi:hypothetical protein
MLKNNEKQTKSQLQHFGDSSNPLTKKELLLTYGGDPTGTTSPPDDDECG